MQQKVSELLTNDAIEQLSKGVPIVQPVVQILSCDEIKGDMISMCSDGQHCSDNFIFMDAQIKKMALCDEAKYAIVRLCNYTIKQRNDVNTICVTNAEVVATHDEVGHIVVNSKRENDNSNNKKPKRFKPDMNLPDAPNGEYVKISELDLDVSKNWLCKARVVSKSDMRTFQRDDKECHAFNFIIRDDTSEICVSCTGVEAKKWHPQIEVGSVYVFGSGMIKPSRGQRNTGTEHEYQINVGRYMVIKKIRDDNSVPPLIYDFVPIDKLMSGDLEEGAQINCIGIIKSVDKVFILERNDQKIKKRNLILVDKTGYEIRMTLWREAVERYEDIREGQVLAGLRLQLGHFRDTPTLEYMQFSTLIFEPPIDVATELRNWYSGR